MSKEKEVKESAQTEAPKVESKKRTLVSGAEYWKFDENPVFVGRYESDVIAEQGENAGKVVGFNFADSDGELHIIGNSNAIDKALNMEIDGVVVRDMKDVRIEIEFLGQIKLKDGRPYNKFKVSLLEG